jgi:hypothetical protein
VKLDVLNSAGKVAIRLDSENQRPSNEPSKDSIRALRFGNTEESSGSIFNLHGYDSAPGIQQETSILLSDTRFHSEVFRRAGESLVSQIVVKLFGTS